MKYKFGRDVVLFKPCDAGVLDPPGLVDGKLALRGRGHHGLVFHRKMIPVRAAGKGKNAEAPISVNNSSASMPE